MQKINFSCDIILIICAIIAVILSVFIGTVKIYPDILWSNPTANNDLYLILMELRLPRAILAFLAGASLGLSGAILQGWLRNPLADSSVLGMNISAALGGVIAIYTGLYMVNILFLPILGIMGALMNIVILSFLTYKKSHSVMVILAGIAMSSAVGALVVLALNLAPDPHTALEITFWLMGSVSNRSLLDVYLITPFIVVGMGMTYFIRNSLDALSLGEDTAYTMGVNLKRLKIKILFISACLVGCVTAVAGSIGFVGLAVPHIMRMIYGGMPSRILLPSALAGGIFVTIADILVRILPTTTELKLGVMTSLLGVPFLFKILWQSHKKGLFL